MPLSEVMKRASAHSCRGKFLNKGQSCWMGSLLQAFFSSTLLHSLLACHRASCSKHVDCAVCALVATEERSRHANSICEVEPFWQKFAEARGLSWKEQQDPLQFCLLLCAAADHFFTFLFGNKLDTTVFQTLPCQCAVELPPPHTFPTQCDYIVPLKVPPGVPGAASLTLTALIAMMAEEESDNLTHCPVCDAQAGFRSQHTWTYGPVVIFQTARAPGTLQPLALEPFLALQGSSYVLRACVCHRGQTNAGHYVCFVLEQSTGLWVRYNDADTPLRLPQPPDCLGTHSAYAIYEVVSSPLDVANLCHAHAEEVLAWCVCVFAFFLHFLCQFHSCQAVSVDAPPPTTDPDAEVAADWEDI